MATASTLKITLHPEYLRRAQIWSVASPLTLAAIAFGAGLFAGSILWNILGALLVVRKRGWIGRMPPLAAVSSPQTAGNTPPSAQSPAPATPATAQAAPAAGSGGGFPLKKVLSWVAGIALVIVAIYVVFRLWNWLDPTHITTTRPTCSSATYSAGTDCYRHPAAAPTQPTAGMVPVYARTMPDGGAVTLPAAGTAYSEAKRIKPGLRLCLEAELGDKSVKVQMHPSTLPKGVWPDSMDGYNPEMVDAARWQSTREQQHGRYYYVPITEDCPPTTWKPDP